VGKVFMVDYDVVDVHNLNRQILYSKDDVGKPKVEAALANAQFHKAGDT
jgi:molybdopterin/thiamine biosynthesis adenylyltransferase